MTLRAGTETGSLVNHLMSGGGPGVPAVGVGDGATVLGWTDRHAATVIKVTPKTVTVREDTAIRTDARGMTEWQDYRYEPNPDGRVHVYRWTKKGWRSKTGGGVAFGVRNEYYDYSF